MTTRDAYIISLPFRPDATKCDWGGLWHLLQSAVPGLQQVPAVSTHAMKLFPGRRKQRRVDVFPESDKSPWCQICSTEHEKDYPEKQQFPRARRASLGQPYPTRTGAVFNLITPSLWLSGYACLWALLHKCRYLHFSVCGCPWCELGVPDSFICFCSTCLHHLNPSLLFTITHSDFSTVMTVWVQHLGSTALYL